MTVSREEWVFASVLSVSHGVQHFFMRLVPPLIPILFVEFDYPLWKLGLLVSAFSISDGLSQAPGGVLSDRYDRRYILAPGLALLGFGYVVFALAPGVGGGVPTVALAGIQFDGTFVVMLVGMVLAGTGGSVLHPTGYPLITENTRPENKGKILGLWGSVAKFGDAAAPGLVGVLTLLLLWTDMVFVFGVLGIVYAAFLFVVLGYDSFDTLPSTHRLKRGEADDDEDAAAEPSVWRLDRRLFVYPMLVILLFFLVRIVATKGIDTFIPQFITSVYGYSLTLFGTTLPPETFANFYFTLLLLVAGVTQVATGYLTDRFDARSVLVWYLSISAVALAVLSLVRLSPLALLGVLLVIGAGLWGHNPARDALVSEITPARLEGRTFGYIWSGTQVVGAASPVVIGYLADTTTIQEAFRVLALAAMAAAAVILLLYSNVVYVSAVDVEYDTSD
ncbi:MFS transporter [Salinigranum sp. GCM10025319]|uniref:MFS transporter n=1 Tax=Salinigranum sp. GCM10025319 TaxID=3252687 RepID=UPI00360F5FE2